MTLGEKIKFLRRQFNITQADFADKLFVSRQAVQKWEADLSTPDLDRIKEISQIFTISIDNLLNDELNEKQLLSLLTKKSTSNKKEEIKRSAVDYLIIIPAYLGLFVVLGICYMMIFIGLIMLSTMTVAMPLYGIFSIYNMFTLTEIHQILLCISFILIGLGSFYPLLLTTKKYYNGLVKSVKSLNSKTKKYWEIVTSYLKKL